MRQVDHRRLAAVAAGLIAACSTLHWILLAAGVGALAVSSAGAFLVVVGIVGAAVAVPECETAETATHLPGPARHGH
jgi:hypothetical protein